VSFRISETDLDNVKRMAASEGLPYQTFLTGIIHKLTTGQLAPRRNK
jgi:predicted DNA binding CopG/RHH family protein